MQPFHPPDPDPPRTRGRWLGSALVLLMVGVALLLAVTTVFDLRNTVRMVRGFERDRALTLLRGLERALQQAPGDPEVLQNLIAHLDDDEVLRLEFFSPAGRLLAGGGSGEEPGRTGPLSEAELTRLRGVLHGDDPVAFSGDEERLELWTVLLPRPGLHRGGRWGRRWRQAHRLALAGLEEPGSLPLAPPADPARLDAVQELPDSPALPEAAAPSPWPGPGFPPEGPGFGPPEHRPVVAHLLFSTRAADQVVGQAYLQAGAVVAGLVLLLAAGGLILLLQRRALQLTRNLHARERLAALGSLSAVLAHEIRNPLAAVKGHAQLTLEELDDDDPLREGLEVIVSESSRLEGLVRSLLDFARPRPLSPRPVAVAEVLGRVTRLRAPELQSHRVQLQAEGWTPPARRESGDPVEDPAAPEHQLLADPEALEQVLHNLIGNALEAMAEGGTLTLAVERAASGVVLRVADTGPGIPPDQLERIFDPYVTSRVRGTGLGLAVARQVVEGLQGRIRAFSEPGQGARFEIWLPAPPGAWTV